MASSALFLLYIIFWKDMQFLTLFFNANFGPKTEPPLPTQICPVIRFKHWNNYFPVRKAKRLRTHRRASEYNARFDSVSLQQIHLLWKNLLSKQQFSQKFSSNTKRSHRSRFILWAILNTETVIFLYEKQNVSERTTERQNVLNLSASLSVTTV